MKIRKPYSGFLPIALVLAGLTQTMSFANAEKASDNLLGLPALEVPSDNPITREKVALGDKLFHELRFSSTGAVACATCHDSSKGFTDSPLKTSHGINGLTGTRNAPTVINAAFNKTQFWDGRSPTLEEQSLHPFINSVEMGLENHEPILAIVRTDPSYVEQFKQVFGKTGKDITMKEVTQAIASFERTVIGGNSRFDHWYFAHEPVLSEQEIRGYSVYIGNGRCVSCHAVEQTSALFTDAKFHNIGVGINRMPPADVDRLTTKFLEAEYKREAVDQRVLSDPLASDLGRFAVTHQLKDLGAFKTSTLRNIELTAPYMHDGSLKTLEEVVDHYNRGGASSDDEKINPYLDGGIRPLNLTKQEKEDLVAFMKTLTSQQFSKKGN
jgi:cytochrome c peroxidase